MHRIESLEPTTPEDLPINDRSQWKFPNDYLSYLYINFSGSVKASTNQFNSNVTDPIRELITQQFPELKSDQVTTLTGGFLTKFRNNRKRLASKTGSMPLASQRKKRQGGQSF